jgi:signal transduction histidine kinase
MVAALVVLAYAPIDVLTRGSFSFRLVLIRVVWAATLWLAGEVIFRVRSATPLVVVGVVTSATAPIFHGMLSQGCGPVGNPMYSWMVALPLATMLTARQLPWTVWVTTGASMATMTVLCHQEGVPPRTIVSWLLVIGGAGLMGVWTATLFQSRKRAQADAKRARHEANLELKEANAQLETSLAELHATQRRLVDASRMAGKAEVATTVLHNVGNVLTSVNVSSTAVSDRIQRSRTCKLAHLSDLFAREDVAAVFSSHATAKLIPAYVAQLSQVLSEERAEILKEIDRLRQSIEHINTIVAMQQANATASGGVIEPVRLEQIAEDALAMTGLADQRTVEIVRDYAELPATLLDRHKVFQILINLLGNARDAIEAAKTSDRRITVRSRATPESTIHLSVEDSGCGIAPENFAKIFNYGFTTKKEGHGFGLHGSACAAMELGGNLTGRSDGLGRGAVFCLELPLRT